ncbi:Protein-glutamine gamma-glutamyltransferase [Lignipirellula cremea]|uniref:Protein-glutamine gamma-glutamyltransferase n=2 Tax=Lignipirellula cremea TaxID=2528010 RepID=A0A518E2C8_9BACT|nr:Protein-glutamine gamma-glutamyltransferase [Lignipirellula cremea]
MGALAALGSIMLGFGDEGSLFPLLALAAAVVSVIVTDLLGLFRLPRLIANLIALMAALAVLADFMSHRGLGQLQSISKLLILLQIVLLFQEKTARIYWQLIVLSALQVVVASALSVGFEFGLLLVAYLLVAIAALTLFFIHRETQSTAASAGSASGAPASEVFVPAAAAPATKRSVSLRAPILAVGEGIAEEHANQLTTWQLFRQLCAFGAASLVIAVLMFYVTPRSSSSPWSARNVMARTVGFNDSVSLDEMGRILQSDELVMRVGFYEPGTKEPYVLTNEPYLRGAVLTLYQHDPKRNAHVWRAQQAFEWRQGQNGTHSDDHPLPLLEPETPYVDQFITLEPSRTLSDQHSDRQVLFSTDPVYALPDQDQEVAINYRYQQIFRRPNDMEMRKQFRYHLGAVNFKNGRQGVMVPNHREDATKNLCKVLEMGLFWQLKLLSDRILQEHGVEHGTTTQKADALLQYLRDEGRFTYTLDFTDLKRDPELDPIVDFVLNHRRGHCEYFASALTTMLRSQEIPARMVIGYWPSEYNTSFGYYSVRQYDAHAWVEVYLPPEEIDYRTTVLPPDKFTHGGWMRYDPTPSASRDELLKKKDGMLAAMDQVLDYLQFLWEDYVEGFSQEKQQTSVYEAFLGDYPPDQNGSWLDFFSRLLESIGFDVWNWKDRNWFSWPGFLTTVATCFLAAGGYRLAGLLRPWLQAWRRQRVEKNERMRLSIEFYRRLQTLLANWGFRRRTSQTPLEFAQSVVRNWPSPGHREAARQQLDILIKLFYRVRFGEAALDSTETQAIENALAALQQAWPQDPPSTKGSSAGPARGAR